MRSRTAFRPVRDGSLGYSTAECKPTPYGPAVALALSLIAWSAIAGVIILLL
jgi:hypothetical protein